MILFFSIIYSTVRRKENQRANKIILEKVMFVQFIVGRPCAEESKFDEQILIYRMILWRLQRMSKGIRALSIYNDNKLLVYVDVEY